MDADFKSGVAAVEEWLQEKYVEYYEDSENYVNKQELLAIKIKDLFFKEGSKNYIINEGKIYYLLNKEVIPEDIRKGLKGGDSKAYADYARLIDVYGVTEDLKLYYCDGNGSVSYGAFDDKEIDPSAKLGKANQNTGLKSAVNSELGNSENKDLTLKDGQSIKELTLTGMTDIGGIEELRGLKKLVLVDCNLNNLDEIITLTKLEYLYLKNTTISQNYSALTSVYGLKYLYIYFPPNTESGEVLKSEEECNSEIERLSLAMANASKLTNLQYLGIFGTEWLMNGYGVGADGKDMGSSNVEGTSVSNLTDISSLSTWNSTVKNSIKFAYLDDNSILNVDCLKDYSLLYEVWLFNCKSLENLDGFKNKTSLTYLLIQNDVSLTSLNGLSGSSRIILLEYIA